MSGFNFKFMLFAVMIIFSGYVFSYSDLGGGICECNSCADCTSAINAGECTDIRLTTAINNQVGTCIDNPANFLGKAFDCQGNLMDGDGIGDDIGIYINGKNNNIIKNCNVQEFSGGVINFGIHLQSSANNTLTNNNVSLNGYGIYLQSSSDNTLIHNLAISNNWHGFALDGGSKNYLINNTATLNGDNGFNLESNSNNFTGNTANSNVGTGIFIYSQYNTLKNNTANSNGVYGIHLQSALNNNLTNNTINSNNGHGISLSSSSNNNNLIDNSISLNSGSGVSLAFSSNNQLVHNTINSNNMDGFTSSGGSNNTLINNTANSNIKRGFFFGNSANNNLNGNTANSNNVGFELYSNFINNNLFNTIASNNQIGVNVTGTNNTFVNLTTYSNTIYNFRLSGGINTNLTNYQFGTSTTYVKYSSLFISGALNLGNSKFRSESRLFSINSTANDSLNATANLSFSVSSCSSNIILYKKIGFPTTLEDILQNGTVYVPSWQECVGNIFTFTVDSFSGYAINGSAVEESPQSNDNEKENKAPSILFVSSTEGIVSQNFIEAVVEAQDDDKNLVEIAIGIFKDSELQDSKTCSASPCSANFSSLDEGIYQLNATATDSKDAVDSTETRTIILDITLPEVEFIFPTPVENAVLDNNAITVSTSASDSNYERTIIQLFKGTAKLDEFSCSNAICTTSYELENGNYSIVAVAYDNAGNKNEIYREFEVFVFLEEEIPVLEEQPSKEEQPVIETEEKQQDDEQNGKDKGSSSSSSASGSNNNGPETEVSSTSETNPVSAIIIFIANNPILVAVPTAGTVGLLLLHRAKII